MAIPPPRLTRSGRFLLRLPPSLHATLEGCGSRGRPLAQRVLRAPAGVDAHFVHPPADDALSGLWAEAALDGVVLFERGGHLSAHLVRVRRAIAEGRLVRRVVHGQPYWTEAA